MTHALCDVPDCARPTHEGWRICTHHAWTLERNLGDIPALAHELETTLTRQTANGTRNGPRATTRPLPYDPNASEATWILRNALVGWTRDLATPTEPWPTDTITDIAQWLLARLPRLTAHEAAGEIVSEIGAAVSECWRTIDRRADRVYAGTCGPTCPTPLYARVDRGVATCHTCDTRHDVASRRAVMRQMAEDNLVTAATAARLAVFLGHGGDRERLRKRINQWVSRGLIESRGTTSEGTETYRFGDVWTRLRPEQEAA